jgi:hypothetical protein
VIQNVGTIDRVVRFGIAVVIAVLFALGYITAIWAVILFGLIGVIMLVTSLVGFCPLYALFNLSTNGQRPQRR